MDRKTKEMQQKQRDTAIDMAAGLLIIVMVMGHVMQGAGLLDTLYYEPLNWFFFFMPWFFFKAGMFHKPQTVNKCIMGGVKSSSGHLSSSRFLDIWAIS